MNQYSEWCDDCRITEPNNVPQCNRSALDRLFIVTNREDEQEDDTQDANDDRALMRFEFIEVIVRIAIAKFIQLKKTDSLPSAIKRLLQDYIKTNRGEGRCNALIDDPTVFRQKHVYTQETDQVLRKHVTMLNQMFRGYCKHSSKGMLLKEWIAMLKDIDLFNYDFTSAIMGAGFINGFEYGGLSYNITHIAIFSSPARFCSISITSSCDYALSLID